MSASGRQLSNSRRADNGGMRRAEGSVRAIAGGGGGLKPRELLVLGAFLLLCLGIGALGSIATARSVATWYQGLVKPTFNPPDWLFAPVWTALYVLIAVAGWRVWRRRGLSGARLEFAAYAAQLALNLAWSFIFFGQRMIGAALVEISVLLVAIAMNAVLFWRIDRLAGWLLAPYAAWVAFACLLNFALWQLN
jgi:tryptophan-rich sensory protein